MRKKKAREADTDKPTIPNLYDWRTTDEEEIARRQLRARQEELKVISENSADLPFSDFRVQSPSGLTYRVEIRELTPNRSACECVDFRTNGLGTCKHVEAVRAWLEARSGRKWEQVLKKASPRIDIVSDFASGTLLVERNLERLPQRLRAIFPGGMLADGISPEETLELLQEASLPDLRVSQEVAPWLETRRRSAERLHLRREYERKVQSGEWPAHETLVPLFPYQREGMLHLAFQERALLADEMGLGKTIQAIAACALLHRLGLVRKVLVVTPASLKTEWEEQIRRFTPLDLQLVFGARHRRLVAYAGNVFFTIVNYEQMISDALQVNSQLKPDVVILDEAQRIKNWNTKTAQAVKRLQSRYAFVLSGTPIENRIDELHSIMGFLNPAVLGPLFRFNREYYELDDRGRPSGYRNLGRLHECIRPYLVRRRKADVETELPDRTDRNFFLPLTPAQRSVYTDHFTAMARLVTIARRRPLSEQEQQKLLRELAMMRMTCDTNYILDPEDQSSSKLPELAKILDELLADPDTKVLIFSEWTRMLELIESICRRLKVDYALHTGLVPQQKRRAEIRRFKETPACRVFLSSDSGSTGLNLQNASVVINCDLPWNPARMEQRIARAWRKNQLRPVTVINLVAEETIEHQMLQTLASKRALADGVLDLAGDLDSIRYRGGRQAVLARLEQMLIPAPGAPPPKAVRQYPSDRSRAFAEEAQRLMGAALCHCEERYPQQGDFSVLYVVVDREAGQWQPRLERTFQELFDTPEAPAPPTRLEVIDRPTAETIERLAATGLIQISHRAIRRLLVDDDRPGAEPLSDIERQKAADFRSAASRKWKIARLLAGGEMVEEAHHAAMEALLALGRALAVEHRFPDPEEGRLLAAPPWSLCWKENLARVRTFLTEEHVGIESLEAVLRE